MAEKFWNVKVSQLGLVGQGKQNTKEAKALTYETMRLNNLKIRRNR